MGSSQYPSNLQVRNNGWRFVLFGLAMFGVGAVIGGVVGVFLFIRITGGTSAPSAPISAPTLSLDLIGTPTQAVGTPGANSPTAVPTLVSDAAIEVMPTSTANVMSQPAIAVTPTVLAPQLFRIVSEESEARFAVSETIPLGTAVGRTNQVAGDIIVDFSTPANSRIGVIRINLRTLQTDDPDRDRSIRCCVLLTVQDAYEFADFVTTSLSGLSGQIQLGQTITFQVTGNLTLRGSTHVVTFDVSLNVVSSNEIRGVGRTVVNRSDFGILSNTENMLDYHGVAEAVSLEFEFVARAVQQ